MTVSIHSRAYRLLQSTPSASPKATDKRLKRSHGQCLQKDEERGLTKDSSITSLRSTSPLSVVDIHEELNFSSSSCSTFLEKSQLNSTPKSCIASKTRKPGRRVHFASSLVSQVKTRPRTLPQDVHRLFYSSAEMSMFRRNYYAYMNSQRKEEENNFEEETIPVESTDATEQFLNKFDTSEQDNVHQDGMRKRQLVIKAVVSHQGETREYYHEDPVTSQSSNDGPSDPCSFDNPEFWNGTITWF